MLVIHTSIPNKKSIIAGIYEKFLLALVRNNIYSKDVAGMDGLRDVGTCLIKPTNNYKRR